MVYHTRIEEKMVKEIYAGEHYCSCCNGVHGFHLYKLKRIGKFFFIPFISITVKYFVVPDCYNNYKELTKEEFKKIEKAQKQRLREGDFPPEIVKEDCEPKKVKIRVRLLKLILSALLVLDFPMVILMAFIETNDIGVLADALNPVFLSAMLLTCLPFAVSLKNFIKGMNMKRAYDRLKKSGNI